jgi:hypothetical protein
MFRDESQGLTAKHQRLKEAQAQVETQRSRVSELPSVLNANLAVVVASPQPTVEFKPLSPLSLSLATSAEDQATCFFFQNYVLGGHDLSKGNFDYLADIYGTEEIGSGLADSVAALGMVGLANFWKAPNIMSNAIFKYNSAMHTTSSQLRDVQQFKSDQTLISILLMGLYEVLSTFCLELHQIDTDMK